MFVSITPRNVWLGGYAGNPINATVTIKPVKKYPFKIVNSQAKIGKNIRFKLKEINQSDGLKYELFIENIKLKKGSYYDQIQLYTDNKIQPRLLINVNGKINEAKTSQSSEKKS